MRSRETPWYNALPGDQIMVAIAMGVESYRKGRVMAFHPSRRVILNSPPAHKEFLQAEA